jgi:hypothetical protein
MQGQIRVLLVLGLAASTAGCATVASGPRSQIVINSYPPNAHVVIRDQEGKEVASVQTPAEVKLDRNVSMTKRAHYTATVESPGYQTQQVDMPYTFNPWSIGNILIGGIPGLVADGASGAMWMPSHDKIDVNLQPLGSSPNPLATSALPTTGLQSSADQATRPASQLTVGKTQTQLAGYSAPAK